MSRLLQTCLEIFVLVCLHCEHMYPTYIYTQYVFNVYICIGVSRLQIHAETLNLYRRAYIANTLQMCIHVFNTYKCIDLSRVQIHVEHTNMYRRAYIGNIHIFILSDTLLSSNLEFQKIRDTPLPAHLQFLGVLGTFDTPNTAHYWQHAPTVHAEYVTHQICHRIPKTMLPHKPHTQHT